MWRVLGKGKLERCTEASFESSCEIAGDLVQNAGIFSALGPEPIISNTVKHTYLSHLKKKGMFALLLESLFFLIVLLLFIFVFCYIIWS